MWESKDVEAMNYEMLIILLKVDEIVISSKVFSKRHNLSRNSASVVLSTELRAICVSSGRVLVLHSTVLIIDSYNDSYVFLQRILVYSVSFSRISFRDIVHFIDL